MALRWFLSFPCPFYLALPIYQNQINLNKHAGGNFFSKSINVQTKIRPCRGDFFLKINKHACTSIQYTRVLKVSLGSKKPQNNYTYTWMVLSGKRKVEWCQSFYVENLLFKLGNDTFQFLELIFTLSLCKMVLLSEHYPTSHLYPVVGTFSKSSQKSSPETTDIGYRKTIVSQFRLNFVCKKNQRKL